MTTRIHKTQDEIEEYRKLLRERFTPAGTRLYVHLNKWTPNATRYMDVYVVMDGRIERITAFVAWAAGYAYDSRNEAIRTQNSELDIVRDLSRRLYGDDHALIGVRLN